MKYIHLGEGAGNASSEDKVELCVGNVLLVYGNKNSTYYYEGCSRLEIEIDSVYRIVSAEVCTIGAGRESMFLYPVNYDQYADNHICFFQRDTQPGVRYAYSFTAVKK